jgi:hypothetical protein
MLRFSRYQGIPNKRELQHPKLVLQKIEKWEPAVYSSQHEFGADKRFSIPFRRSTFHTS